MCFIMTYFDPVLVLQHSHESISDGQYAYTFEHRESSSQTNKQMIVLPYMHNDNNHVCYES